MTFNLNLFSVVVVVVGIVVVTHLCHFMTGECVSDSVLGTVKYS